MAFNAIYNKYLEPIIKKVLKCPKFKLYKLDETICVYIIKRNSILNDFIKRIKNKENIEKKLYTGYSICYIYDVKEKFMHII